MRDTPLILAVDDTPENLEILSVRLEANGYEVQTAADGEEGLARARELEPDLILLDIMMPKLDGISVVRELKRDAKLKAIPVILVTAKADTRDIVAGLDAGGDDYLTKPFEHAALLARVRSMLRQKALHDTVQDQARELAEWNTALEGRVAEQVDQIERIGRLQALPAAAGRRPDRRLGRSRDAAWQSPPGGDGGVLRPARLHRLRREGAARRRDGGPRRVSRRLGRADPRL